MQAKCLRLMGKKLLVALALEGKFAGEGLQALDEDDDMLTIMARELIEKNRIGESADAVWRTLNGEHRRIFGGGRELPVLEPSEAVSSRGGNAPAGLIEAALCPASVLVFGEKPRAFAQGRKAWPRRSAPPDTAKAAQGLLFE